MVGVVVMVAVVVMGGGCGKWVGWGGMVWGWGVVVRGGMRWGVGGGVGVTSTTTTTTTTTN